jgi:hypothetical protein
MMHYRKWQRVEYIVMTTKRSLIMMCNKIGYEKDQDDKVAPRS